MAKAQITAVLFITLLLGAETARVSTNLESNHKWWGKEQTKEQKCAKLMSKMDGLANYLPAKTHKVETKGVAGVKGSMRIIKLGRKVNDLAAAINKFEELGCDGDISEIREGLSQASAEVKSMTLEAGDESAGLAAAMARTEQQLEALKTKPAAEQEMGTRVILAGFVRSCLSGGGEMTQEEQERMLGSSSSNTSGIFAEAEKEAEQDTDMSLLEMDDRMGLALVEMEKVKVGSVAKTGNIFADSLIGVGTFLANMVLTVLGLVWLCGVYVGMFVGFFAAIFGFMAAGIVCTMWWLLGQMVEFLSVGHISFGQDIQMCHDTLWLGPVQTGERLLIDASSDPWHYTFSMLQTGAKAAIGKVNNVAEEVLSKGCGGCSSTKGGCLKREGTNKWRQCAASCCR